MKENGAAKSAATGKSSTRSKPQVAEKETEKAGYQKPTQVDFILMFYKNVIKILDDALNFVYFYLFIYLL